MHYILALEIWAAVGAPGPFAMPNWCSLPDNTEHAARAIGVCKFASLLAIKLVARMPMRAPRARDAAAYTMRCPRCTMQQRRGSRGITSSACAPTCAVAATNARSSGRSRPPSAAPAVCAEARATMLAGAGASCRANPPAWPCDRCAAPAGQTQRCVAHARRQSAWGASHTSAAVVVAARLP